MKSPTATVRFALRCLGIAALALAPACTSDSQPASATDKNLGPIAPAAGLERFHLGDHTFPVTTTSPAAQRAFDRGLTLAYGFAHQAAEQEFHRAAELDPECAMAWWGAALVNGPHINYPIVPPAKAQAAWTALGRAQALAARATPLEKALIDALATRYTSPPSDNRAALDSAYAAAMRRVWHAYPQSADVGTLFAEALMDLRPWDLWTADGKPQPGTDEILATLESAIRLDPRHPGANHLYIHVVEASPHPEQGIASADLLRDRVPGVSHLLHMPAHIYVRVGRWNDAATANLKAIDADAAYRSVYPRAGFYNLYMAHNLHFLGFVGMMQGRSEMAIRAARTMAAEIPDDFLQEFGGVADGFLIFPSEVLVRFGRWEAVLEEPAPRGRLPFSTAMWHFTRATALNALARADEAATERKKFLEAAARIPSDATFGNNPATSLTSIAAQVLDGEIAARQGRFDDAIARLRAAVVLEDALRYDEPPDWVQPVRHTLGAVLLRAGRSAEAEAVYRQDLARFPENGWSLFGLGQALRLQKKDAEAAEVEARFKQAWTEADMPLRSTCLCLPGHRDEEPGR